MRLKPTFADRLAERGGYGTAPLGGGPLGGGPLGGGPLVGLWASAGSAVTTEIVAGSGADVVLIDGEHGPVGIDGLLPLLQATEPYAATTLVRVPWNDPVVIKQMLDVGAQNLIVPMVSTVAEATAAASAMRYPPRGTRGIGSALARASRWATVPDYVARAHELVSLTVQIETVEGVANAAEIAAVDGVDALFVGPADLAGSMGFPPADAVREAVVSVIAAAHAAGTPVGVNAFAPADADHCIAAGADFVIVGADVLLVASGARAMLARLRPQDGEVGSY